jgi:preprotein translocase SecE subunit
MVGFGHQPPCHQPLAISHDRRQSAKASSSIGRAPVSKTGGWGFDSLLACQSIGVLMAVNSTTTIDNVKVAAGGRIERLRLFLSEVRNELKRVTWPSQKEVYATTVVVIATSVFFGLYLFALDQILLAFFQWILRRFGAA